MADTELPGEVYYVTYRVTTKVRLNPERYEGVLPVDHRSPLDMVNFDLGMYRNYMMDVRLLLESDHSEGDPVVTSHPGLPMVELLDVVRADPQ